MIIFYIILIVLAAVPVVLISWRMQQSAKIKKNGTYTNGVISHISTIHTGRAGTIDMLTITYTDRATGKPYNGRATVTHGQYKTGDTMEVAYLPHNPSRYAIDTKKGYLGILIFCILLFLFVIFAVYKLSGMVESRQII